MKKVMSKMLIILLIVIMLFEFTCSGPISYASDEGPNAETINLITNLAGGIVAFILWIPRILVVIICDTFVGIMTTGIGENCGISDADVFVGTKGENATPFDIFFNKYNLLSVDFFDIKHDDSIIDNVRISVAQWFYAMRLISAVVLMCVLVYVGIRMALSTIADEKARYKKMLVDWVCSLALVFVLQYIAVFTISANEVIVNFLRDVSYTDINSSIKAIADMATKDCSLSSIVATIVYAMISFQTIAFMITYIQRMLKVGFLLIISPLISITYAIDKMGDGKAQALDTWLKEFVYTILIQPFHCIMYVAFVNTAIELLSMAATTTGNPFESMISTSFNQLTNGLLVILCLKFINDGEKAIRKIFNFQDDASLTSMAAGAALGLAALTNAKKIGSATAKGFNKVKGIPRKFGNALANDLSKGSPFMNKLKQVPGVGKLAESMENKMSGADGKGTGSLLDKVPILGKEGKGSISKAVGKFKQSNIWTKHGEKLTSMANAGKKLGGIAGKTFRRSMPIALGMMGAAMSYATGTSGTMEAIGIGSALNSGANEFFSASTSTLAKHKSENNEKWGENKYRKKIFDSDKEIREKARDLGSDAELSSDEIASGYDRIQACKDVLDKPILKVGQIVDGKKITKSDVKAQRKERAAAEAEKRKFLGTKNGKEAKELENLYKARKDLAKKEGKQEFLAQEMTDKRLASISNIKHGKADIENKKNEIMQKILEFKAKQNEKNKQVGNYSENHFTEDDVESADAAMKFITDSVDRNVIGAGGTADVSKILKRSMGLYDDGSAAYQSIMGTVLEYQEMMIAADAENIEDNALSAGIELDSLHASAYRRTRNATRG